MSKKKSGKAKRKTAKRPLVQNTLAEQFENILDEFRELANYSPRFGVHELGLCARRLQVLAIHSGQDLIGGVGGEIFEAEFDNFEKAHKEAYKILGFHHSPYGKIKENETVATAEANA